MGARGGDAQFMVQWQQLNGDNSDDDDDDDADDCVNSLERWRDEIDRSFYVAELIHATSSASWSDRPTDHCTAAASPP